MPELPEVQMVRRSLQAMLLHPKPKTIKNIKAFYPVIIKDPAPNEFINKLIGQKFIGVDRYGKYLMIQLQQNSIISHLRMEGKYFMREKNFVPEKHDHIQFLMTDGTSLVYNDVRKFGTMHLVNFKEEYSHPSIQKLGPEVNNEDTFTPQYLEEVCKRKDTTVKELLLNQELACGLGNIYVDETLYYSHVHPQRKSRKLKGEEIGRICFFAKKVIDQAIQGKGTTIRSFSSNQGAGQYQNMLKIYGRNGQKCQQCNATIQKIKVGGRGTHFCPRCQG